MKTSEAFQKLAEAERVIDALLDWALSNRDSEYEFITCYTYRVGDKESVIEDAKAFLVELKQLS